MAIDLSELLGGYSSATASLLANAMGAANVNTGGARAPEVPGPQEAAAAQAPPSEAPHDPFANFLAGFQAYMKRRGGRPASMLDQLAQGGSQGLNSLVKPRMPEAGQGGQGLASMASVQGTGPRAGQARLAYDLNTGGKFKRAHVYFDEDGRRRVFKF